MEHEHSVRLTMDLNRYIEIKKKVEEKKKELIEEQNRRDALLDFLVYTKGQSCPTAAELETESTFPLVLGKMHSKFSISCIGILPPEEYVGFYNTNYIYPVGYKSKRRYNALSKADPKVLYHCHIRNVNGECVFEIRSSTGRVWSGTKERIWSEFVAAFEKISFPNIESFFGLTHETVQKLIEEMGDISVYTNYVPHGTRIKRTRKGKKHDEQDENAEEE